MDATERKWLERGLLEAVLAGDETAWKALYDGCFDRVYAHVYYRVGRDRHRAEEVVQETWLTAVKRIRRFDPDRGTFEQWMRGIAEHVLLNQRRRWRRDRTAAAAAAADARIAPDARGMVAEQVALAMAGLPRQYQIALRAKYEEQLPVAEIAARWKATPKAVESLLARARAAFREAYRGLDAEGGGVL
jgi:RNA polymerase sigma-70 factor (ECF subfamily)